MNDFTSYELHTLLWAIFYVRKRTNNCGDTMRSLRTKIQQMIELYDCKVIEAWQCEKCGHIQKPSEEN